MSNDAMIQSELLDHKADNEQHLCQILSVQELSLLNDRSNSKGLVQLAFHLTIMGCSGYISRSALRLASSLGGKVRSGKILPRRAGYFAVDSVIVITQLYFIGR